MAVQEGANSFKPYWVRFSYEGDFDKEAKEIKGDKKELTNEAKKALLAIRTAKKMFTKDHFFQVVDNEFNMLGGWRLELISATDLKVYLCWTGAMSFHLEPNGKNILKRIRNPFKIIHLTEAEVLQHISPEIMQSAAEVAQKYHEDVRARCPF